MFNSRGRLHVIWKIQMWFVHEHMRAHTQTDRQTTYLTREVYSSHLTPLVLRVKGFKPEDILLLLWYVCVQKCLKVTRERERVKSV